MNMENKIDMEKGPDFEAKFTQYCINRDSEYLEKLRSEIAWETQLLNNKKKLARTIELQINRWKKGENRHGK